MVVLDTYVQEGLLAHESDGCNAVSAKSVKLSLITFGFIVPGTKLILSRLCGKFRLFHNHVKMVAASEKWVTVVVVIISFHF